MLSFFYWLARLLFLPKLVRLCAHELSHIRLDIGDEMHAEHQEHGCVLTAGWWRRKSFDHSAVHRIYAEHLARHRRVDLPT